MKRIILAVMVLLLALTFTVGAEAKNGEREKKFFKMFPVPKAPQNNNNNGNNNTYNYYYYNNDYYGGQRYYRNNRCGWITLYEHYYDYNGNPVIVERQTYHCQGQRD